MLIIIEEWNVGVLTTQTTSRSIAEYFKVSSAPPENSFVKFCIKNLHVIVFDTSLIACSS